MQLDRLLRPRHVAAVGGAWARNVVQSCLNSGFDGQVWPVHNLRSSVMGIRCFKSVADLPCPPDCTFIGVNRTATIDVVLELRRMGAGGAICFASGFAESYAEDEQGEDLQKALKEAAGDMPVLGPNCYGLINYLDNAPIWPDVHGGIRRERGVALVCQSSNIALNLTMQSRGLPLAYVVTVGNQAVVSQAAIASSLLDDSRVTAIGLYVEGFGDIREYASLARRARARRVPVVVLKAGVSGATRSLTMSHTSSLAGSPEASRALLKRLDFGQVNSVTELVETLKLLHLFGPLPGRNLGAMSCSGGEACLMADSACHADVRFPSFHEKQSDALRSTLGPMVHLSNPLDYHTYLWGRQQALQDVFHAMMLGSYDLTCLVIDFPRADRCRYPSWKPAIHALRGASEETGSRAAVVATLHENLPEDWSEDLMNMGIVPFHGIGDALRAAAVAADIGVGWGSKKLPISTALAKHGDRRRTLMDIEARDEFAGTELKFPQVLFARDCRELEEAAEQLAFPVVLKRPGIQHKTEEGAVVLDIRDAGQLLASAVKMGGDRGYLVEQQVAGAVAEILIGVTRELESALLLTIGSGGIHTELFKDVRHLLLPTTADSVLRELKRLRAWKLLEGFRGRSGGDVGSLVQAALAVGNYAVRNAETLVDIEVNPFLVLPNSGYAVDLVINTNMKRTSAK